MTTHVETRRKLMEMPLKSQLREIFDKCNLTESERKLLQLYYIDHKDMRYIGDYIGCGEKTAIKWHGKALKKIAKII